MNNPWQASYILQFWCHRAYLCLEQALCIEKAEKAVLSFAEVQPSNAILLYNNIAAFGNDNDKQTAHRWTLIMSYSLIALSQTCRLLAKRAAAQVYHVL